jgi:AcrR family transcriptional regulator
MGTKERREREKERVRRTILDAARELFVREGYDAVSMRKLADAIEYSPAAVYSHFADKRDLMRELCRADFGALSERARVLASITDPVERIQRVALAYLDFAAHHPNHYRFMFMTSHPHDHIESEAQMAELGRGDPDQDGYAFLKHAVQEAIDQCRFRPEYRNADVVAQMLWSAVHGVASLQIAKGDDPWCHWKGHKVLGEMVCAAIMRGLLRDESPRRPARYRSAASLRPAKSDSKPRRRGGVS